VDADTGVSLRLRTVAPRQVVGAALRSTGGGRVVLRLFTYPAGRRELSQEHNTVLTALLFCLADPMAQGTASVGEVQAACNRAPLGLSGAQLAAARRLSLVAVSLHLADMAVASDSPVRRTGDGFTI